MPFVSVRGILSLLASLSFVSAFERPSFPEIIAVYGERYGPPVEKPLYGYVVVFGRYDTLEEALEKLPYLRRARVVEFRGKFYLVSPVYFSEEEAKAHALEEGKGRIRKVKVVLEVE